MSSPTTSLIFGIAAHPAPQHTDLFEFAFEWFWSPKHLLWMGSAVAAQGGWGAVLLPKWGTGGLLCCKTMSIEGEGAELVPTT